ncbi:MAG TPA: sodium-dependent transporter [Verrucomicrobiae bacterium]|nr:sodium-dependent transporter [Verrucomicrobiae bacterium]
MAIRESSYGYWRSSGGFVLVAAGTTIGIGNIARLPYLAGEYGGAIFLFAYVFFLAMVAWPLLVAEWLIGRWTREDLISGLGRLAGTARLSRAWSLIGVLALVSAVLVLSYYSVIAGWSLAYGLRAAGGVLNGLDQAGVQSVFFGLAQDPERSLAWHTIFMVVACLIVASGVRDGIERAARYLVPAAFALMFGVFIFAYGSGDTQAAIHHMLTPQWSRFGWRGMMEALHQAFFTLGLGLGAMVAYGTYLPRQAPIARFAVVVVLLDTVFSLVAGAALYAIIFAAGLDPAPGLTVLFQVFPLALSQGAVDGSMAMIVYAVMFLITLVAASALMEPAVRYLVERMRITRAAAAVGCAIGIWFLGLGTLLSFNIMQSVELLDRNFFDWLQWLTGRFALPLVGLMLALVVHILPNDLIDELWGDGSRQVQAVWRWMIRFPVRISLMALLLYCVGFIDAMVALWN